MKRVGLFRALLVMTAICIVLSACSATDTQEPTPAPTPALTSTSEAPENSPAAPSAAPIAPGSLSCGYGGGAYWGFQGHDKPSIGQVLSDYVELRLNMFVKIGYNITLGLEKELADDSGTAEDYFAEQLNLLPKLPKQIYVLYVGETNEAFIHTGADVPEIDLDAVKSTFQDTSVAEPALRAMIAIKALADELMAAEITSA